MKRKISCMMVLVLLCTMFVVPVSAAEVSNISDEGISVAATTGTTYFSKTTTKLNSLNGLEASSLLSSGTCLGNTRNITSVTVNCRVSSGSSRYILKVTSPSGTVATKTCGTTSTTYTFTEFRNEDPDGKWTVSIASQGVVTTVTGTLKVNYSYSY